MADTAIYHLTIDNWEFL